MEIQGKIIADLPMQEGVSKAGNNWKKKEWVLETINTPYPRKVKFTLFGDRADNIHIELGKVYSVTIEIESREWNGRWFTDVNGLSAVEIPMGQPGEFGQAPFPGSVPGMAPASTFGAPAPGAAPAAPAAPGLGAFGDGGDTDLPF